MKMVLVYPRLLLLSRYKDMNDIRAQPLTRVTVVNDWVATIRATPQATRCPERSGRQPRSVAVHASSGAVTSKRRTNEPQPPPPVINNIPLGRLLKSRIRRNDAVVYRGRDSR